MWKWTFSLRRFPILLNNMSFCEENGIFFIILNISSHQWKSNLKKRSFLYLRQVKTSSWFLKLKLMILWTNSVPNGTSLVQRIIRFSQKKSFTVFLACVKKNTIVYFFVRRKARIEGERGIVLFSQPICIKHCFVKLHKDTSHWTIDGI